MKKTVLITGASGGIGAAIAKRFAESGYAVVLQYRTGSENAQKTAASFPDGTVSLCAFCDLNDPQSIDALLETVHRRVGSISALVNCAGTALPQKLFIDTTDEEYDRVFHTNVRGTVRITRAFCDDIRANRGSIVNIASMWGVTGGSCEVLYSASKAAVIGFTKALAKELAPSGVTVNCVAPGLIDTPMNAHLPKEAIDAFAAETPLGRIGMPEDVADAALYLAEAGFVTGQVLCCDGGYTI